MSSPYPSVSGKQIRNIIFHPSIDRFVWAAAWLLSAVADLVLLIACTNLAGFLLARSLEIVARTSGDPERTALDMVATARELDPELILWTPRTMERHLGFVLLPLRLSALLLAAFAVLGIALASVGLYGVVSYAVSQRTREVGIRMSFGASVGEVTWMLMAAGMKLVMVGSGVGLVLSYFLTQAIRVLLYELSALDPLTFLAAPLILLVVAAFATFVAARRASRINPVTALRTG